MSNEPIEALSRANVAATRALEHQPNTTTALLAKAVIAFNIHFDHEGSEAYYQQAIESNGDLTFTSYSHAMNLMLPVGRYQEAANTLEVARLKDPLAPLPYAGLSLAYGLVGRIDDATLLADYLLAKEAPAAWYMHLAMTFIHSQGTCYLCGPGAGPGAQRRLYPICQHSSTRRAGRERQNRHLAGRNAGPADGRAGSLINSYRCSLLQTR
jgi:tetratricopeptide (TPR) repeat protein